MVNGSQLARISIINYVRGQKVKFTNSGSNTYIQMDTSGLMSLFAKLLIIPSKSQLNRIKYFYNMSKSIHLTSRYTNLETLIVPRSTLFCYWMKIKNKTCDGQFVYIVDISYLYTVFLWCG